MKCGDLSVPTVTGPNVRFRETRTEYRPPWGDGELDRTHPLPYHRPRRVPNFTTNTTYRCYETLYDTGANLSS